MNLKEIPCAVLPKEILYLLLPTDRQKRRRMKHYKTIIASWMLMTAIVTCTASVLANDRTITYSANIDGKNLKTFGTGKKESYDVAILLSDKYIIGKKIEAISVPLNAASKYSNIRMWVSKKLNLKQDGTSNVNAPDMVSVDATSDGSTASATLPTPYTIDSDTLYVGYSFDIDTWDADSKYPVIITGNESSAGFWIHSSRTYHSWTSMKSYGCSAIEVMLSGADANAADFSISDTIYGVTGKPTDVTLSILNHGYNGVKSIDYTYTIGGTKDSSRIDLAAHIPAYLNASTNVDITLPAMASKGNNPVTLTITKVNGYQNCNQNISDATLLVYNFLPKRNPVMEEYTGTWCGWCPRGWVALEVMNRLHPEFIGLSYHKSDLMQTQDADNMPAKISSYPSAVIDRGAEIVDPYHGKSNSGLGIERLWTEEAAVIPAADITTEATFADNGKKIAAKANIVFPIDIVDADKYSVEFVLIADSLRGTGSQWAQHNYFSPSNKDEMPEPEAQRFLTGANPISNIYYNDVVIASTRLTKGLIPLPAHLECDKPTTIETVFLTDSVVNIQKESIIQNSANLRIAALLINNDGTIANAAKGKVIGAETTGINDNGNYPDTPVAIYNMQAHRLQSPQRGVNIIVYKSGKSKKIIL